MCALSSFFLFSLFCLLRFFFFLFCFNPAQDHPPFFLVPFFFFEGGGAICCVVNGRAADRNFCISQTTSHRPGFFSVFSFSVAHFLFGLFFFLSYRLTMQNQLAKMKEVELFLKQFLCLLLFCFRIAPCVAIEAEYHGSFLFRQPFFFPFVRTLITFFLVFFFWFYDFISNEGFYFLLINGTLMTGTAARGALSKKKDIICPNGVLSSAVRKLHEIEWSFFTLVRALKKGQTKNPYTHFFFQFTFG